MQPAARRDDLVIQEFAEELLVYDLRINKAICLNRTSALVWQNCDGKKNISQITAEVEKQLGDLVGEDVVWFALSQLEKENLLTNGEILPGKFNNLSRREIIKKIGLTSMVALPIVSSLVAPMAIHAQSCVPNDGTCTASAQCCSMCCKNVGGGVNECKPGGGACLP
jgi:hypothetical protein